MNTSLQVRVPQSEHDEPPNGIAGRMRSVVCGQEDLCGYKPWPQTRHLLHLLATVSAGVRVWAHVVIPEPGQLQRL